MKIRTLRFISILLAALALGMHLAHALELAPKLSWSADLYVAVQTSLYEWFGKIGPIFEVGALISISFLAYQLRGQGLTFRYTLISSITIIMALLVWLLVVMPANMQIMNWDSLNIPDDWTHWRDQWQYAQAGIFILHLIGFSNLIYSVIRETPES